MHNIYPTLKYVTEIILTLVFDPLMVIHLASHMLLFYFQEIIKLVNVLAINK